MRPLLASGAAIKGLHSVVGIAIRIQACTPISGSFLAASPPIPVRSRNPLIRLALRQMRNSVVSLTEDRIGNPMATEVKLQEEPAMEVNPNPGPDGNDPVLQGNNDGSVDGQQAAAAVVTIETDRIMDKDPEKLDKLIFFDVQHNKGSKAGSSPLDPTAPPYDAALAEWITQRKSSNNV